MKWREKLMPVVSALQPMARVAERVAAVAVHIQRPTAAGIAGLAATAVSALSDQLGNSKAPYWSLDMFVSRGLLIQAINETGARVVVTRHPDGAESVECRVNGMTFWVNQSGTVSTLTDANGAFVEWLRQTLDRVLPSAIEVRRRVTNQGETYESRPVALSQYGTAQADRILAATLPLIEGGRCILLDGKPGVGKTTMAQIIARQSGLGRTVMLDSMIIGHPNDAVASMMPPSSSSNVRDALRALSPGVVIVDDIDKIGLSLERLESLRASARLVVLTANNGQFDDVLDGALMRAGRVDEVFTVEPSAPGREPPFDRLTDAEWSEVCEWPVAYLNEARKRLQHRPDDLRLNDLRDRLSKRTRSGDTLR